MDSRKEGAQSQMGTLSRNQQERIVWIRRKVAEGYYDSQRVKLAVAEAFLDPPPGRRAGEQAVPEQ